jgi:hypothetical protein
MQALAKGPGAFTRYVKTCGPLSGPRRVKAQAKR